MPAYVSNNPNKRYNLEGFLFPDTYSFNENENADFVVKTMINRFEEVWQELVQSLNLSIADDEIEKIVNVASIIEKEAVVDFYATWCGPCRMQAPILEQLEAEFDEDDLKIVKIDVDENPETARSFGIMSIPTLMFKKDGKVVKQVSGVHTKDQLKAIIEEINS